MFELDAYLFLRSILPANILCFELSYSRQSMAGKLRDSYLEKNKNWGNGVANCIDVELDEGEIWKLDSMAP